MEAIHCITITCRKSYVDRRSDGLTFMNPELRLTRWAKATPTVSFFDNYVTQYGKDIRIKRFTNSIRTNFEADMIEHDITY
jgi:hypothetical protein